MSIILMGQRVALKGKQSNKKCKKSRNSSWIALPSLIGTSIIMVMGGQTYVETGLTNWTRYSSMPKICETQNLYISFELSNFVNKSITLI